jgi:hypothetical protein
MDFFRGFSVIGFRQRRFDIFAESLNSAIFVVAVSGNKSFSISGYISQSSTFDFNSLQFYM